MLAGESSAKYGALELRNQVRNVFDRRRDLSLLLTNIPPKVLPLELHLKPHKLPNNPFHPLQNPLKLLFILHLQPLLMFQLLLRNITQPIQCRCLNVGHLGIKCEHVESRAELVQLDVLVYVVLALGFMK